MSENPAFPDAHPTAPGGMSQKALVAELVEKHGYPKMVAKALSWPEMIDAVCAERRARELEAEHNSLNETEYEQDDLADDLDPDEFMAELAEARAEVDIEPETAQPAPLFLGMPDSRDFIFDGHAGAGPSGAERWMNCPASLAAAREFLETLSPNQQRQFAESSSAARQGTTAHAAAEIEAHVILGEIDQTEADAALMELAIMPEDGAEAYDDEMADYITEYVDLVKSYVDSGREVRVEARVRAVVPLTGPLDPDDEDSDVYEIAGSADFVALPSDEEPDLVVGDLKYGDGIHVEVDENPQIRIYALGVLSDLADEEGNLPALDGVTYYIVQPRLGGIKVWKESVEDLLRWRDEVLSPALSLALAGPEGGATYEPSEQACQWCPARGGCAALAEQRVEAAAHLFDTVVEAEFADGPGSFPETTSLTDTRLGELLAQITGLIDIHKDLKDEAQRRLHRGGTIPGFKLVSYTPPRKWKPEASNRLDTQLHHDEGALLSSEQRAALWSDPKLITPTQAVKVLGADADVIAELIDTPDKRPVVAPEGDRRKAWEGRPPEQMFPDTDDYADGEEVA